MLGFADAETGLNKKMRRLSPIVAMAVMWSSLPDERATTFGRSEVEESVV
jgi:hypothetical protein